MRLTKAIKDQIIDNAIKKAGLYEKAEWLRKERAEIAEKIRREFVSEEIEKELLQMQERFGEIQKTSKCDDISFHEIYEDSIYVAYNGMRMNVSYNGVEEGLNHRRLVACSDRESKIAPNCWSSVTIKNDHGLFNNEEACNELAKQHDDMKADIKAVLDQCTTDSKLIKIWPESVELIPKPVQSQSKALIVDVSGLNESIGLPSDQK